MPPTDSSWTVLVPILAMFGFGVRDWCCRFGHGPFLGSAQLGRR